MLWSNKLFSLRNIGFVGSLSSGILFEDDYSDSVPWTQVGAGITVDDVSFPDVCHFNAVANLSTDRRVHRALGTTLNDTTWSYDFKLVVGTVTIPSAAIINLTAGTSLPLSSNQDLIGVFYNDDTTKGVLISFKDSSGAVGGTMKVTADVGTYYGTLERVSATLVELTMYSDVERETSIGTISETIPSTIISLTSLQHANNALDTANTSMTFDIDDSVIT